jgi:hypothetical protein
VDNIISNSQTADRIEMMYTGIIVVLPMFE